MICPGPSALTHGVVVGVVLEGVLPDQVCVCHELTDGDVLVFVDVGQQSGEVHGLLDHHQVVGDLQTRTKREEEGERGREGNDGVKISKKTKYSCEDNNLDL